MVGLLSVPLSVAVVVGALLGMFALEPAFKSAGHRDIWLFLTLAVFFIIVYLLRNRMSGALDAWVLGVRGGRLTREGTGALSFRDARFAAETKALTDARGAESAPVG